MTARATKTEAELRRAIRAAAELDMQALRERAALAWPTEADPEPVPFQWGEYDRLTGDPVPGVYWDRIGEPVHIRKSVEADKTWKAWLFSHDGETWHTTVRRGRLYRSRRDALVARRWVICRGFAADLARMDDAIRREGGSHG